MDGRQYLEDSLRELQKLKSLADRALAQVPDDAALFSRPDERSNNLAILMKHMAGNMRSRWTDFLTTDGDKPDRNRDGEFELGEDDTAAELCRRWEAGWATTLDAIGALTVADLKKTVTIRGEPHTVPQAIQRQTSHYAYHVGQIVYLAHHLVADGWSYLSIAPGKSAEYDVDKDGNAYLADPPSGS